MRDTSKFKNIPFRIPNELHARASVRLDETGGRFQGLLTRLLERWLDGDEVSRPPVTNDEAARNAKIVAALRELMGSKSFERLVAQLNAPSKTTTEPLLHPTRRIELED